MIILKSSNEIEIMREAGKVVAYVHEKMREVIKPGITTLELDEIAEKEILKHHMIPAFKGYGGFPGTLCTSVNDEVVHGIPSNRVLKDGDIISIDAGTIYKGYCGDSAKTFPVGTISEDASNLIKITRESFYEGLKFCKVGFRLSDVSNAIQKHVEAAGYSVVKDFVGHGIGKDLHEEPQIPNYGKPGKGPRLAAGMVLAIEPMVNIGTDEVDVQLNNWTVVTVDHKWSAHYEHSLAITEDEPILLTAL